MATLKATEVFQGQLNMSQGAKILDNQQSPMPPWASGFHVFCFTNSRNEFYRKWKVISERSFSIGDSLSHMEQVGMLYSRSQERLLLPVST